MTALIEELLALSKIDSAQTKAEFKSKDITEIIRNVACSFSPTFENAGKELKIELADNAVIMCDERQMRKVISNLISNAFKFCKTTVWVKCVNETGKICVTISDDGEGISKEDEAHIFERFVPELCAFAAAQDIAILTYNHEGIVCERDKDEWANKECFTTKLPMIHVDDLASYVNYPVCKMLITLDPARRDAVCAAGQQQFAGRADLYPSSPFFIEAVPLGVAKDGSLAELLRRMGLTRENLMACGDGLNDRSMIAYAGVGVAMQNAEQPVKDCADYVTTADNNHDGVAEAVEKFILRED